MKNRFLVIFFVTFFISNLIAQENHASKINLGFNDVHEHSVCFELGQNFVSIDHMSLIKKVSEPTSIFLSGKSCTDGSELYPLVSLASQKSMSYCSKNGELRIDGLVSGDILLYFKEDICEISFYVSSFNSQISFEIETIKVETIQKSQETLSECSYAAILMRDQSASVSSDERHEVENTMTSWLESMKEENGIELTLQNADFSDEAELIDRRAKAYSGSAMTYQSTIDQGLTSWSSALELPKNQTRENILLILLSDSPPNMLNKEKVRQIGLVSSIIDAKKNLDERGIPVLIAGFDDLRNENMRFWTTILGLNSPEEFEEMEISELLSSDCTPSKTVEIYPNPASDYITLSRLTSERLEIDIVNSTGKVVYSTQLTEKQHQLNLSSLFDGTYYISIDGKRQSQSFTIIK